MADWFKLYENDIDHELLQWAMTEQPSVAIVYIALMSRCCRDKVGTLSWSSTECDLLALANKLHISVPIANQCLDLLKRIGYIEMPPNSLKLLSWNKRQSEYCQRKGKVSRHYPDNVPTVSGYSPLLSSDLISSSKEGDFKRKPETSEEWLETLKKSEAYSWVDMKVEYSKAGIWCQSRNRKLTRRFFLGWLNRLDKPLPNQGNGKHTTNGAELVLYNDEYKRILDTMRVIRSQYQDHQTWTQSDLDKYGKLKARKTELKTLLGIVA